MEFWGSGSLDGKQMVCRSTSFCIYLHPRGRWDTFCGLYLELLGRHSQRAGMREHFGEYARNRASDDCFWRKGLSDMGYIKCLQMNMDPIIRLFRKEHV
jgi:hypothetical protein